MLVSKLYPRGGGRLTEYPIIYFHRFYRILPPIMLLLGFYMTLFQYIGDGPIYPVVTQASYEACDEYWWTIMVFISNMVPWTIGEECFWWLWYMANDMQFFWITPPLIYLYIKNRRAGHLVFIFLVILSIIANILVTVKYELGISNNDGPSAKGVFYADEIYIKPWTRVGVYAFGVLTGIFHWESKNHEKYPHLHGTLPSRIMFQLKVSPWLPYVFLFTGAFLTMFCIFIV